MKGETIIYIHIMFKYERGDYCIVTEYKKGKYSLHWKKITWKVSEVGKLHTHTRTHACMHAHVRAPKLREYQSLFKEINVGSVGCASKWRLGGRGFDSPAEVGNILSWRLIMKYFLRSFSPFHWFKRAVVSFWRKNVHNTG